MCKESEKTSTTSVPGFVQDASQKLISKAETLADKPFEPYTGERVAGLTADQQNAFQQLRDLIAGAPKVGADAVAGAQHYANAPAQSISTERVVDEGGKLGSIEDYLNPNNEQAKQPALRKIMEAADAQRKRIGASATSAGAFGDARHGIVENQLDSTTSQAIGDTSAKFMAEAFDKAMGLRTGDLNRFGTVDKTNADYAETALGREMLGSKGAVDIAGADQKRQLEQIQALLASGAIQQGTEQAGLDALFQEFMRAYGNDYNVLDALSKALGGSRGSYDTTQTTSGEDNSLLGLLGSIAGKAVPALLGSGGSAGTAAALTGAAMI